MLDAIPKRPVIALAMVFSALQVVLGLLWLDEVASPWAPLLAMLLYAAATAVALDQRAKVGRRAALFCSAASIGVAVLVCTQLPLNDPPGYAAWHPAALQTLAVILVLRGRVAEAAAGAVGFVLVDVLWSLNSTIGLTGGLMMAIGPVGWFGVALGVRRMLNGNAAKIAGHTRREQRASDRNARDHAVAVAREQWMAHVLEVAGPMLSRIADPAVPLSEEDRRECLLVEGQFRDEIRGRILATDEVLRAARSARARGVKVDILDDRQQDLPAELAAEAADRVVAALDEAEQGSVTARARPAGSGAAVTILSAPEDPSEEATLVEIDEQAQAG